MSKQKRNTLKDRAKRLDTINISMREAEEAVEVLVGQLKMLDKPNAQSIEDTGTVINDELAFLKVIIQDVSARLVRVVAHADDRSDVHRQMDEILEATDDVRYW